MTISLRLSQTDGDLIKAFAENKNMTVSSYIRKTILKDIEKEYMKVLDNYLNIPEDMKD